jgi:dynein heavy chain 2
VKSQAAEQEHKLAEKQAKANSALMMITETMRNANTHKVEMEALKEQTERENLLLMERFVILIFTAKNYLIFTFMSI